MFQVALLGPVIRLVTVNLVPICSSLAPYIGTDSEASPKLSMSWFSNAGPRVSLSNPIESLNTPALLGFSSR